jgi:predicted esterase
MMRAPFIAAVVVALAAVPGAAQAKGHARLKVTGTVQGMGSNRVGGSFVVTNVGTARSRRTTARLAVRVSSRRWSGVKSYRIPALAPRERRSVRVVPVTLPRHPGGRFLALRVCVGATCRTVGTTRQAPKTTPLVPAPVPASPRPPATTTTTPAPSPTPAPTPAPRPSGPPVRPTDTTPPHPIAFTKDTDSHQVAAGSDYWLFVPDAYDASHRTPSELFVWMHGCGGDSQGDLDTYANSDQSYIMISLDGARADDGCWDVNGDPAKVLSAIADVEDKFNIDQRRIVIGGYSSGGDLAYRTAFYNAYTFAGLLAENTSPFRDTGSTADQSLAAAAWRFPIVHLAHTGDEEYHYADVQAEIGTLQQAGWNATLISRPGRHYDANTDRDLETLLLPHLDDGWQAP